MNKFIAWFRQSLITHYVLFLFVVGTISLYAIGVLMRPTVREFRSQEVQSLVELIYSRKSARGSAALFDLAGLRRRLSFTNTIAWEVDGRGRVFSTSGDEPLTLDWANVKLPDQGGDIAWLGRFGPDEYYAMRLIDNSARFLVFRFTDKNVRTQTIAGVVIVAYIWSFLVAVFAALYLLKRKEELVLEKLRSESGFSLVSGLVLLTIAGMVTYALLSLLTVGFRSSSHTDLRYSAHALANTLEQRVDCGETFKTVVASTDCGTVDPSNSDVFTKLPKPIVLRDSSGAAISSYQTAASTTFDPTDDTLQQAGKLGDWHLRAYCIEPNANLVVRFSKPLGNSSPVSFVNDPLLKRPFDWKSSTRNPLFGTPDRVLCTGASPGGGSNFIPMTRSVTFSPPGPATWTVPAGVTYFMAEIWGGGGGGGGARSDTSMNMACGGGGGGSGGYAKSIFATTPGTTYTISAGSGGQGNPPGTDQPGLAGNRPELAAFLTDGANSSIAQGASTLVTVQGGRHGTSCVYIQSTSYTGFNTGFGGPGGCQGTSCPCTTCLSHIVIAGGRGASGMFNYTTSTYALGGSGGNSPLGGMGGPPNWHLDSTTDAAIVPGGGGGGGSKAEYTDKKDKFPGVNGAAGRIVIWY